MKNLFLCLTFFLLPLFGCNQQTATPSTLPTVPFVIGSKTYTLEIASTTRVRNKGLMYRDSMPEDHGMIFIFAGETSQSFWMHNTRIPLDILYLDATGRIVSIHRMEAYDEHSTTSKAPAKYAIELNAGQARAAGTKEGDVLNLPPAVKDVQGDPQ